MIKHLSLATVLAFTMALTCSTGFVRAASTQSGAIADFLTIGFANAPNNFKSIMGADKGLFPHHVALRWPDRTHFRDCEIIPLTLGSFYGCYSVRQPGGTFASCKKMLFAVARAIQSHLPSGYASTGPEYPRDKDFRNGNMQQVWSSPGKPEVYVVIHERPDNHAFFAIGMYSVDSGIGQPR